MPIAVHTVRPDGDLTRFRGGKACHLAAFDEVACVRNDETGQPVCLVVFPMLLKVKHPRQLRQLPFDADRRRPPECPSDFSSGFACCR